MSQVKDFGMKVIILLQVHNNTLGERKMLASHTRENTNKQHELTLI